MEDILWVKEASAKIKEKMPYVTRRTINKMPYTTKDQVYNDQNKTDYCWWTNGFWGGMMWQLYHATNDGLYMKAAINNEEYLDRNLMNPYGMDHDSGFKWLTTAVADYRLWKDDTSYKRARLAAENMAGRFNPAGNFIRAWNDGGDGSNAGIVIIDCMMNLPLLYWAYEVTNDPRFYHIAVKHADTIIKNFIREDGSSIHIGKFNAMTGEFIESLGGQGMGVGTSWTRGQSWALYGFTLSYIHTKEARFLDTAKRVADYFVSNIPESGFIPVDFYQPKEVTWEDSTAAAIASCGLIELAKIVKDSDAALSKKYEEAALKMLKALYENRCNWDKDVDNIVEKCTAAYHDKEHEFAIIYGDYYFIEAIFKLTGEELFIW